MNAHSKPRRSGTLRLALAGAGILGIVSAVGITYAVGHRASASTPTATSSSKSHRATEAADKGVATSTTVPAPTTTAAPTLPSVTSITPAAGATSVSPGQPVTIQFSGVPDPAAPQPTISPSTVTGTWTTSGSTMTFTPTSGWMPFSTVTVTVPGAKTTTASFVVAAGSPLRLQQLLALLGYLPVSFVPTGSTAGTALAAQPTTVAAIPTVPAAGSFTWTYANTPASLTAQWNENADTVITQGAVMTFEADHNLTTDGVAGPQVWAALLNAVAARSVASHSYNYLMVSKVEPENLQVWSKGAIVASSIANTGAPGAATADGTFPVFEHLLVTTMKGTNPNGTKYVDPGIKYVAYFNGGDAVHEYLRASYGWPQSNGCVELPATTAETIWGWDPVGTLVTVA